MKLDRNLRRHIILQAAVRVALQRGLVHATLDNVAAACSVKTSRAAVAHYFRNQPTLCRYVAAYAETNGYHSIVDDAKLLGFRPHPNEKGGRS